jgi:ABC-2 type transport system permease protein
MYFPPLVIPMAVGITAALNLGMTLVAVLIFVFANGIFPDWSWLQYPVLLALLTIFALGVGMLLSSLYVRYRDVQPIWEVTRSCCSTPARPLRLDARSRELPAGLPLQPAGGGADPDTQGDRRSHRPVAVGPDRAGLAGRDTVGLCLGTFALGYAVFRRESPRIAENL